MSYASRFLSEISYKYWVNRFVTTKKLGINFLEYGCVDITSSKQKNPNFYDDVLVRSPLLTQSFQLVAVNGMMTHPKVFSDTQTSMLSSVTPTETRIG